MLQVRVSVLKGITDMAKQNLEQEQLISEVKNHIAIVRLALILTTTHVTDLPAPQRGSVHAVMW